MIPSQQMGEKEMKEKSGCDTLIGLPPKALIHSFTRQPYPIKISYRKRWLGVDNQSNDDLRPK